MLKSYHSYVQEMQTKTFREQLIYLANTKPKRLIGLITVCIAVLSGAIHFGMESSLDIKVEQTRRAMLEMYINQRPGDVKQHPFGGTMFIEHLSPGIQNMNLLNFPAKACERIRYSTILEGDQCRVRL